MIEVKAYSGNAETLRVVNEWPERTAYLLNQVPHDVAAYAFSEIAENIPNGPAWVKYKKSLRLAQVTGVPKNSAAWLVFAKLPSRRIGVVDAKKYVLYVEPQRKPRTVPAEVSILERFSPWTIETLPFVPKKSEARVVSRKVNLREFQRVERARTKDKPKWRPALDRLGVRRVKQKKEKLLGLKTVPDLAFEVLRLEFGLGGTPAKPHWRPAIRKLIGTNFKGLASTNPAWSRALMDPKFAGWKRRPGANQVSAAKLKDYQRFQSMVAIRV